MQKLSSRRVEGMGKDHYILMVALQQVKREPRVTGGVGTEVNRSESDYLVVQQVKHLAKMASKSRPGVMVRRTCPERCTTAGSLDVLVLPHSDSWLYLKANRVRTLVRDRRKGWRSRGAINQICTIVIEGMQKSVELSWMRTGWLWLPMVWSLSCLVWVDGG